MELRPIPVRSMEKPGSAPSFAKASVALSGPVLLGENVMVKDSLAPGASTSAESPEMANCALPVSDTEVTLRGLSPILTSRARRHCRPHSA